MAPGNVNGLLNNVPKLDGTNYNDWKFAVSMVMRRAGCWEVVNGQAPKEGGKGKKRSRKKDDDADGDSGEVQEPAESWESLAENGLTIIGLTIEPSQYPYIRSATNGAEAWEALAAKYEKKSRTNRLALKRQFYALRLEEVDTASEYIVRVTTMAAQLRAIDVKLEDEDIIDVMIMGFAPKYPSLAATLGLMSNELTVNDVSSALEDEEQRQAETESGKEKAMLLKGRRVITCYLCGKDGHIVKDCPDKPASAQAQLVVADEEDFAF